MRKFIYGRIMGLLQLLFWLLMIPWIIITIPLDLYYTYSIQEPPTWLAVIYEQSWIDWSYGLMIIATINMMLFCGGLIWLGWTMMHPISDDKLKISNIDRLKMVKSFSKKRFLRDLHQEGLEYQKKRIK